MGEQEHQEFSVEPTRPGYKIVEQLRLPLPLPLQAEGVPSAPTLESRSSGLTIAKALHICLPDKFPTMTSARKMIRRGEVLSSIGEPLNTTFNVTGGETLFVQKRSAPGLYPRGDAPFELEVLHEDDDLAVVVKPPGVLTHKNKGEGQRHTVKTCLAYTLKPTASLQDALHRPVAAHRLDGPTGGLLVAAKTRTAAVELSRQFAEREVKKTYTAIVAGKLEGEGIVEIPLRGLEAVTRFRALRHCRSLKYEHCTLVALSPETGRTHQLRRHMLGLAHPIIGDRRYTGLSIEKPHWT